MRLAERIARQLVFKFDTAALGDRSTWRAMGELLRREAERLQTQLGLVERQIVVALPKLSAKQIEDLLEELQARDATIARTVLNAALDAADPLTAARRYLAEFHGVVDQLKTVDPGVARTLANATFMAHAPREKAMSHFKRFAELMQRFRDDVEFVRTVARAAFRAPDPIKAKRSAVVRVREFAKNSVRGLVTIVSSGSGAGHDEGVQRLHQLFGRRRLRFGLRDKLSQTLECPPTFCQVRFQTGSSE